ncbi:MAG: DNA-deoxyinosine glycosylase [Methanomassiliicoccus sp.]|nr:MAG: DNA-deoxyinosine glycosylase [Methanomassiliicoccus sp.]
MPTSEDDGSEVLDHRVGLPLIIGDGPKVLILGTIPSVLSDSKQEYYGNPQNHFWRIIYQVFDSELDPIYERRLAYLREKGIALWDVLGECDIDKSKDHSIINPVANDLASLFRRHTSISYVFLNGKKAYRCYEKLVQKKLLQDLYGPFVVTLPSSSPANAVRISDKVNAWKVVREALAN